VEEVGGPVGEALGIGGRGARRTGRCSVGEAGALAGGGGVVRRNRKRCSLVGEAWGCDVGRREVGRRQVG
jgi:hypothetical protein